MQVIIGGYMQQQCQRSSHGVLPQHDTRDIGCMVGRIKHPITLKNKCNYALVTKI